MLKHTCFYFIRHGQTDWNLQGIRQGQTDIPLNTCGKEQIQQATTILAKRSIKHIVSSPLSRAKKSAQIINQLFNLEIILHEGLKEVHWGRHEGKPKSEVENIEEWHLGTACYGGESSAQFRERVITSFNTILSNYQHHELLIVAHGGVFWQLKELVHLYEVEKLTNALPVLFHAPGCVKKEEWVIEQL